MANKRELDRGHGLLEKALGCCRTKGIVTFRRIVSSEVIDLALEQQLRADTSIASLSERVKLTGHLSAAIEEFAVQLAFSHNDVPAIIDRIWWLAMGEGIEYVWACMTSSGRYV